MALNATANPFDQFSMDDVPPEEAAAEGVNPFDQFTTPPVDPADPVREPFAVSNTPIGDFLESSSGLPAALGGAIVDGVKDYTTQAIPGDVATGNPVTAVANLARPVLTAINEVGAVGVDAWMASFGQIPGVSTALEKIANSDLAVRGIELAAKAGDAWDGFSKAHPVEAAIIADAGVVAEVLPAGQAPKLLRKASMRTKKMATGQSITRRRNKIRDLILPASKVGAGETTEKGSTWVTRRTHLEPDAQEDSIIKAMETLDTVKPERSLAYNLGATSQGSKKLAKETDALLKRNRTTKIDFKNLDDKLAAAVKNIEEIPGYHALRGDAQVIAQDYLKEAQRILAEAPKTPMGLLQARRDFDAIVNQGGDIFGSPSQTAKKVAATHIRNEMNSHLLSSVNAPTGGELYDLLNRQHNLMLGKDMLKGKAAAEANHSIRRALQRMQRQGLVGTTALSAVAAITSFATLGMSPIIAGAAGVAATVGAGVVGYKLLKGPAIKRGISQFLRASATVIDKTDRVMLVELMKLADDELEQVFQQMDSEEPDGTGT